MPATSFTARAGRRTRFLPGEREIRDAAEACASTTRRTPRFCRCSPACRPRSSHASSPHGGRRIVLATNVAETSLTVPGIPLRRRYRAGARQALTRIATRSSSCRSKRSRRPPPTSVPAAAAASPPASASGFTTRWGSRRGRPSPIRKSCAPRWRGDPAHEVAASRRHRGVSLLEAPSSRAAVADGYQLLQELNALDGNNALTGIGHGLAKLPLDPRIARMIVAARDGGCLKEVLVIAAALSVQDPRERPQEKQGTADAAHAKWADEKSEFLSWLKLWNWYEKRDRSQEVAKEAGADLPCQLPRPIACVSGATSIHSCMP